MQGLLTLAQNFNFKLYLFKLYLYSSKRLKSEENLDMKEFFRKCSHGVAEAVGTPAAFLSAVIVIILWLASGPFFHFSDTWQLIINTGTTIVTFLMVFLIQNSQNRDSKAIHLKLNELLRGVKGARTGLVELENLTDSELEILQNEFHQLHRHITKKISERKNE